MKVKSNASIKPTLIKKHQGGCQVHNPHLTNKLLSTVYMPSQHVHCGGIRDSTQVYLELKLAIEVLLHHIS